MKLKYFAITLFTLLFAITAFAFVVPKKQALAATQSVWWQIQSIDTMKYSRDMAQVNLGNPSFDTTIDTQIRNIAGTGANFVALGTPYDDEFLPILKRWVTAARKYNLHVWFRGNFSGWEGWFNYPKITRSDHQAKLVLFIHNNPDLFADGDIFTACPECENGGPGDPRQTGDVSGHRQFLISETQSAQHEFDAMGKKVVAGYTSMNYDVAKTIMDPATTHALGGVVTIDHYVASPDKLASDVTDIARQSGGKIFLGEFGAPIPDINGDMNESSQNTWVNAVMTNLIKSPELIGVNYWVSVGGSTEIWDEKGNPTAAVATLTNFFTPKVIEGTVYNQFHVPVSDVDVSTNYKQVKTDADGQFTITLAMSDKIVHITKFGYLPLDYLASATGQPVKLEIEKMDVSFWETMTQYVIGFFHR